MAELNPLHHPFRPVFLLHLSVPLIPGAMISVQRLLKLRGAPKRAANHISQYNHTGGRGGGAGLRFGGMLKRAAPHPLLGSSLLRLGPL